MTDRTRHAQVCRVRRFDYLTIVKYANEPTPTTRQ